MLKSTIDKKIVTPAIFLCLLVLSIIFQNFHVHITDFPDRIMGNALLNGIDITKQIHNFYLLLFILFPLITFILFKLLQRILTGLEDKILQFIHLLSILGIINFVLFFISYIKDNSFCIPISIYLILVIQIALLLFCYFSKKYKYLDFESFQWSIIAAIPIPFVLTLFFHKFSFMLDANTCWLISYAVGVGILFFLTNLKSIHILALQKSYLFFLCAPLLECIFLEFYNICNQYQLIIFHKSIIIFIIYFLMAVCSFLYYDHIKNKKIKFQYQKYYYPIIIIIFAFITAGVSLVTTVNTDFFESANHGMGVYEFFRYNRIPLIETFDAHMLSSQFFGILYGLLNHDTFGAIFCLYSSYETVILYIILYTFLKYIFSRNIAFLTILFFPILADLGLSYYTWSLLAILTLLYAFKKRNFLSFFIYWLSLAFLCIWKLDLGFSASIASVILLIYLYILERKNLKIKNIVLPLFLILSSFLSIYVMICWIKNINPIFRAIEFIKLAMSNINWGYATLGNPENLSYIFGYYIMPLIIIGILFYIFYHSKFRLSDKEVFLVFLGLCYIVGFQRGLVRHSLVENQLTFVFGFALIYISIFITYRLSNKEQYKFWIFYIIAILFNQLLLTPNTNDYFNLSTIALNKYTSFSIHDENSEVFVNRVKLSDSMKQEYENLKSVLDIVLDDHETYLDFTNQTLLYALLDKEKPVYVNQSPGLLSGDTTQKFFLQEIQNSSKKVSVVLKAKEKLVSESMDALLNDFRYYLISEFIYQNYEPITIVDHYEVWVLKENKDALLKKLKDKHINTISSKEYLELDSKIFEIGHIPFIWEAYSSISTKAVFQMKNAINLTTHSISLLDVDMQHFDKSHGNYLKIRVTSSQDSNLRINFLSDQQLVGSFLFTIKEGTHDYTIRISTMYAWYCTEIDQLSFDSFSSFTINQFSILNAD